MSSGEHHAIFVTLNGGRGSGAVVSSQTEGFQQAGYDVSVVSTQPGERPGVRNVEVPLDGLPIPIHDYLPGAGDKVPVYSLDVPDANVYKNLFEEGIERAIDESGIPPENSVMVVHHANIQLAAAMAVADETGIPYFCMPHGTCIEGFQKSGRIDAYREGRPEGNTWGMIREALNQASGVIAISKYMKDTQIDPNMDNRERVYVIYNPLPGDVTEYDETFVNQLIAEGRMDDSPYILQVGLLTDWKRPQDLAAASHDLPDGIQTVFVGHDDAGMAERVVREGKNCVYLGPIYGPKSKGLMRGAKLLAVSSMIEPFGLTPIEAGSLGVPSVIRPSGAPPEFIEDGFNGYVATDLSVEAYGDALSQGVTEQPELWGDPLSQYTMEKFGPENTTQKIIDLARGLI